MSHFKGAACSVFGQCGGCKYQDISYDDELALKEAQLIKLFQDYLTTPASIFDQIIASPHEYHYRSRIDLKLVQTKKGDLLIGYTPLSGRGVIEVNDCPIARQEISDYIPTLKGEVRSVVKPKYRQANLVVRSGDEMTVRWGGIGRRSLQLDENEYFYTQILGKKIFYSLDTFFQANLFILPALFDKLASLSIWGKEVAFYDLYGGVGLFSFGLMDLVKEVILIEDCKASVKLARFNAKYHNTSNVKIVEGKVENVFNEHLCHDQRMKIAMIDPPRAGLSVEACQALSFNKAFTYIIYLSCNPDALIRDLKVFMSQNWHIMKVVPLDFFPRTKHLETLCVLKRQ